MVIEHNHGPFKRREWVLNRILARSKEGEWVLNIILARSKEGNGYCI